MQGMTWRQLAAFIAQMSEEQKDTNVTIEDGQEEFFGVQPEMKNSGDDSSNGTPLDNNHPYLSLQ